MNFLHFSFEGVSIDENIHKEMSCYFDYYFNELSAPLEGTGSDMLLRYAVGALVPTLIVSTIVIYFGML